MTKVQIEREKDPSEERNNQIISPRDDDSSGVTSAGIIICFRAMRNDLSYINFLVGNEVTYVRCHRSA